MAMKRSLAVLTTLALGWLSQAQSDDSPVKFETCTPKTLSKMIQSEQTRLNSQSHSDVELRSLFLNSDELGVRLTLLNPKVFQGKVIMSSLALKCWVNLYQLLENEKLSSKQRATLRTNWQLCATDLYEGTLPPIAKHILKCLEVPSP